jgi:pimeloyl-ACP methyl ester carboxylesterase
MLEVMKIRQIDTIPGDYGMLSSSDNVVPCQYLNSISTGEGPPAILVHGLAASLHDWEVLVPELASYAFQAFAVDLFGHGDSPKPELPELYTISTLINSFEAWIEQLELDSSLMLVGHSLGGHVCLQYGLRHPDRISCMVLIDPFFRPAQLSPVLRLFNKRPKVG